MTFTGVVIAISLFLGTPYIIYKIFFDDPYAPFKLDV